MSYFWPADEDFFSPFNDNEQISVKSEYDDCPFSFADDPSVYGFDPKKERESPAVEGFSQPVAESPQPVAVLNKHDSEDIVLKINKPLPTPEEAIERINKAAAADPKLGKRLGCAFAFCILMNRVKSTICDPTKKMTFTTEELLEDIEETLSVEPHISAPEIIGVEKSTWKRRFRKLIDEVPGVLGVSRSYKRVASGRHFSVIIKAGMGDVFPLMTSDDCVSLNQLAELLVAKHGGEGLMETTTSPFIVEIFPPSHEDPCFEWDTSFLNDFEDFVPGKRERCPNAVDVRVDSKTLLKERLMKRQRK